MAENILNVHANQLAITLKIKYDLPVSPYILNGYLSDHILRIENSIMIHSANFLPMPIHKSPLLCIFQKINDKWVYRWTDSIETISLLTSIINCYSANPELNYYKENKEMIDKERIEYVQKISLMEEELIQSIQNNFNEFVKCMENATFKRIHIMETFLWKIFKMDKDIPLEYIKTPHTCPNASLLPKDRDFKTILNHFFETKDAIKNERMAKCVPEDEDYQKIRYFSLGNPKGNLYNGYLDEILAKEYYNFMQIKG